MDQNGLVALRSVTSRSMVCGPVHSVALSSGNPAFSSPTPFSLPLSEEVVYIRM